MDTNRNVNTLKGVGEKTEKLLNLLGIYTVGDLLEYYPRNYDTYEQPISPEEVQEDKICAINCLFTEPASLHRGSRAPVVTLKVKGPGRFLYLTWYHRSYLKNILQPGKEYIFRGKVVRRSGKLLMEQPEIFTPESYQEKLNALQPIYPLTEGLSNRQLQKFVKEALDDADLKREFLPSWIRKRYHLAEYNFAISQIHFPKDEVSMRSARERLVFDEFFTFQLAVWKLRGHIEQEKNECVIVADDSCQALIDSLPYELTGAQKRTWKEIEADLAGSGVMHRLIQGDVGSGKTIVALLALLATVKSGYQGCMMVPTEILARQHFQTAQELLSPYGVRTVLLTGHMGVTQKRETYEKIASGEADLVIGTHALIQEKVNYHSLGLVVTDEQHRFGVTQRESLSQKGTSPHVLVMSATPIPRTLAIILYGDLDISIIDELPAQRIPIKNCVIGPQKRAAAYRFIEKQVREGHQVYVICPFVEKSDLAVGENVLDYTKTIRKILPADISVECLHGKQKAEEKNSRMERFLEGRIDVLVSTTVVEVGVDVPNATVMMVEDAQRFGLAQLHQLRGRVGRGQAQSYCIFVNTSDEENAQKRLDILVQSNDGFFIAQEDLKLRGPGDLFGIRQSGIMEFKIGNIFEDMDILKEASQAAKEILKEDENLEAEEQEELKARLEKYLEKNGEEMVL